MIVWKKSRKNVIAIKANTLSFNIAYREKETKKEDEVTE